MDDSQATRRQGRKDKKGVDLDNLKREVEMVSVLSFTTQNHICYTFSVFTRESSYYFHRVLAIAILSVRSSVYLSHGWISQKRCKL